MPHFSNMFYGQWEEKTRIESPRRWLASLDRAQQYFLHSAAGWDLGQCTSHPEIPQVSMSNWSHVLPLNQELRFTRKPVKFSEESKPTSCQPERSVRVPRIHPQSVPLSHPVRDCEKLCKWTQNKTRLTWQGVSLWTWGFFRIDDVTQLWNVGKLGASHLPLLAQVNLICLINLPSQFTWQKQLILPVGPMSSRAHPALLTIRSG